MKINSFKILYSTTIPIQSYGVNDKIAVEIELSEGEIAEAIPELKKEVDTIVAKLYPNRYGIQQELPEWMKEKTEPTIIRGDVHVPEFSEEALRSCTDLKVLSIYESIIDREKDLEKREKLFAIYDEMFNKLSNQK